MSIRSSVWKAPGLALIVAAVLAAGVAACSDDDEEPPAATGATGAAATGSTGTTGATGSTGATGATGATTGGEALAVTLAESDLGSFLVGPDGRTLYIFTRDEPNATNCEGNCLDIWPPLLLEEGQEVEAGEGIDGEFGMIDTPSGTQVTYREAPLYYFASDAAAGETKGHLVGDVWFVARPDTASTAVVNVEAGGEYLVGPTGLTLYLFANDTAGVSNCTGTCLENWPALTVPEGLDPTAVADAAGELATITRDGGVIQVTYNGLPLYYYVGDSVPGDTTGDGVGGVWSLATP